ncbi:hypothetical protein OF83DRAFT_1179167 [Amylostereum chailletii]|nr:hypothetical protein OF83DRAFT_1179167 [Amylostereum chailletii]
MSDQPRGFRDPLYWDAGLGANYGLWTCNACKDNRWREAQAAKCHESGAGHRDKVAFWEAEKSKAQAPSVPYKPDAGYSSQPPIASPSPSDRVQGPLSQILSRLKEGTTPMSDQSDFDTAANSMELDDHEGDFGTGIELGLGPSAAAVASLSEEMSRFLDGKDVDLGAGSGFDIPSFMGIGQAPDEFEATGVPRIRETKNMPQDPQWFPWSDRVSCVLDILRHLPRSVFSDAQMEMILWAMAILGVNDLPSVSWLKDLSADLQEEYGIRTLRYQGALGHVYYANSIADQIVQEFSNPRIALHLQFYPEDAGSTLSETWQSQRWRHEADPSLLTPMVRIGHRDFYIHEPAKLTNGKMCMPMRWFQRISATTRKKELWADVCRLEAVVGDSGPGGFALHEYDRAEVPITSLSLNFPQLVETFQVLGLPDPRVLLGTVLAQGCGLGPWKYTTDPSKGNDWRIKAKGCRVVSFMIWLYCDDTSGNMSKKWNKHNSFLWTAAGLPREMAQQQYNVHFLSTSNLAPPLEMLDGIVAQLEDNATAFGFGMLQHELVLVIPAVLALLGDNPMQSEMACHIGLRGKFFCRCCWVKGRDAEEEAIMARALAQFANIDPAMVEGLRNVLAQVNESPAVATPPLETITASPPGSITSTMAGSSRALSGSRSTTGLSSVVSNGTTDDIQESRLVAQPARKGARAKETLEQMKARARRFLMTHAMRTKDETIKSLGSVFTSATCVGGMTAAKTIQTEKGVKDMFQQSFMDRIFALGRKLNGSGEEKQEKIYRLVATFPDDVTSPVWRIKDLDPHKDIPVEILHVILLGFVKYFWRDIVTHLNAEQKSILATQLSSLDISGLGISPLAGPFVLYDLAPPECLDAWVALCQLIPLIWQPEIHDLEKHLKDMEDSIENFLRCTAKWTPRWFNKPKFHLIRHLPYHVRRFGPAIVQHNCTANQCDMTATAAAMQEREDTGQTIARVRHYNTDDVLLNLTQQRSSKYPYFLTPILEDLENAILIGATREFDEQKWKAGDGDGHRKLWVVGGKATVVVAEVQINQDQAPLL